MRRGHGKCNEADQAQRCEIALVLDQGRELPQQQARERIISPMDGPRNADDADRNRNDDGKFGKPRALRREYPRTVSRISGSRTNNEEKLPGKRIEVPPLIVGIAVRLPTEVQRQKINYPGEDEWKRQAALQQQQDHGKYAQQDHVDREDVEELGLILHRGDASLPLQSPSVNRGGGVARNKDEDLGGIGKCNRMQRYIRQDIIWNVVDEDDKQRQTPEEVEP